MIQSYRFGQVEVRLVERVLLIDGKPAVLGARAFDVLHALIEHRGCIMTKEELMDLAWPGLMVEENNLQVQISTLRKLLGQHAVVTIPGRGYQFALADDEQLEPVPATKFNRPARSRHDDPPASEAPLIERHEQLAEVRRLFGQSRLVTVKGTSSSHKLQLSAETGYDLLAVTPDGVWFVDLDTARDPSHVVAKVRNAVGQASPVDDALHDLIDYLSTKDGLLIIDNCEQVMTAVGTICTALLHACPNLKVLCTSQDILNIAGEHVYRLPNLAEPDAIALYVTRKGQSLPSSG